MGHPGGPPEQPGVTRPLRLHEVLEQEYLHIDGRALPPEYEQARAQAIADREASLARVRADLPTDLDEAEAAVWGAFDAAMAKALYHLVPRQAALCLSGGGIRSATFNLGILQGLARHDLLRRFDYLSTVSGGGYIGSWLSAWIHRRGFEAVNTGLKPEPTATFNVLEPEAAQIRHLRSYSNYWTPKLGFLSADTWSVIAAYLRNLLLNWAMLLPLFLAVLLIPRMGVRIVRWDGQMLGWLSWLAPYFDELALGVGSAGALLAMMYIAVNLPSMKSAQEISRLHGGKDAKPWWLQRYDDEKGFLLLCLLPLCMSALSFVAYWAWLPHDQQASITMGVFIRVGLWLHALAWAPALILEARAGRAVWQLVLILVIVVAIGVLGGFFAWGAAQAVLHTALSAESEPRAYVAFAAPLLLLAFVTAGVGLVGALSRFTTDEDREWWGRSSGWMLIVMLVWSAICTLVLFGPEWVARGFALVAALVTEPAPSSAGSPGAAVATGVLSLLTGLVSALAGYRSKAAATSETGPAPTFSMEGLLKIGASVFAVFLIIFLSMVTTGMLSGFAEPPPAGASVDRHMASLLYVPVSTQGWLAVGMVLWSLVLGLFVNVNKFSLHALYRNRLIQAYLSASRAKEERTPVNFTGFDQHDNVAMTRLSHLGWHGGPSGIKQKPFHVVNIALNLVKDDNLAWQERKAESFTVTPLHAGSFRLGYRYAKDYGQNVKGEPISLGTAMAISGAAASPNSGYHSSPAVTFVMTVFNLRLGWWLGNPGQAGQDTYGRSSPRWALSPMLNEAFGRTDQCSQYVYLSDGGHFENLGIYEMVMRRCRFILVIDAGQDEACTFEDLGNAIRKIRIDFGIHIDLDKVRILPRKGRKPEDMAKYCAVGRIRYTEVGEPEDGTLIYLKPTLCPDDAQPLSEPMDVYNYGQMNEHFPHDPTMTDQWFSESQFESYRALGSHVIERLWSETSPYGDASTLDNFEIKVRTYLS